MDVPQRCDLVFKFSLPLPLLCDDIVDRAVVHDDLKAFFINIKADDHRLKILHARAVGQRAVAVDKALLPLQAVHHVLRVKHFEVVRRRPFDDKGLKGVANPLGIAERGAHSPFFLCAVGKVLPLDDLHAVGHQITAVGGRVVDAQRTEHLPLLLHACQAFEQGA